MPSPQPIFFDGEKNNLLAKSQILPVKNEFYEIKMYFSPAKGDYLRFLSRVIGDENHFPTTTILV